MLRSGSAFRRFKQQSTEGVGRKVISPEIDRSVSNTVKGETCAARGGAFSQGIKLWSLAGIGVIAASPTLAQDARLQLPDQSIYEASLLALTVLLVVAILIENALELVFDWKVFKTYFNESGVKTVISFAVSLVVVRQFEMDIIASLLTAYGEGNEPQPSTWETEILTAMVIAGGSSGVHNVLRAFGWRGSSGPVETTPPQDRAWIAVQVTRSTGKGALQVAVTEDNAAATDLPAMAGTVMAAKPSLRSLFTRNTNRFPHNGGYEVTPGKAYRVSVIGVDQDGKTKSVSVTEGPIKLAPRAVVDFDVVF